MGLGNSAAAVTAVTAAAPLGIWVSWVDFPEVFKEKGVFSREILISGKYSLILRKYSLILMKWYLIFMK